MKSLPDQPVSGGCLQPLEQAAALPEIPPELPCSKQTLISLCAIVNGLLANTLSSDIMYLSLMSACHEATRAGVSLEEYQRVQDTVVRQWEQKRRRNPLHSMF